MACFTFHVVQCIRAIFTAHYFAVARGDGSRWNGVSMLPVTPGGGRVAWMRGGWRLRVMEHWHEAGVVCECHERTMARKKGREGTPLPVPPFTFSPRRNAARKIQ